MKGKLLLLVVLAVGLFSCRKDKYDFSVKNLILNITKLRNQYFRNRCFGNTNIAIFHSLSFSRMNQYEANIKRIAEKL